VVLHWLNSAVDADSENSHGGSSTAYVLHGTGRSQEDDQLLVKDVSGRIQQEGKVGSTLSLLPERRTDLYSRRSRHGTRGTARFMLRSRSALEKCSVSEESVGVSVMRMHLKAG
jgi:hypothetical protein